MAHCYVKRFVLCTDPPTELSPAEYKEKHMVLVLNLIDTDHHRDYAVEILQQYGKVSLNFGLRLISVHTVSLI